MEPSYSGRAAPSTLLKLTYLPPAAHGSEPGPSGPLCLALQFSACLARIWVWIWCFAVTSSSGRHSRGQGRGGMMSMFLLGQGPSPAGSLTQDHGHHVPPMQILSCLPWGCRPGAARQIPDGPLKKHFGTLVANNHCSHLLTSPLSFSICKRDVIMVPASQGGGF